MLGGGGAGTVLLYVNQILDDDRAVETKGVRVLVCVIKSQ